MAELNHNINHIRWQCRRGMLELDEILSNFFINSYKDLSVAMQKTFEKLLQCNDADLFDWLIAKSSPIDIELRNLIILIAKQSKL
jgi:antitoxin CptB